MAFMKDYKKPPFSKSRQANPIVKPSHSSATTTAGTSIYPFQSARLAYSSSPSTSKESTLVPHLPEHPSQLSLSGFDLPPSSQVSPPRGRSAGSYPSKSSSVSLVEKNSRTTPVHVPRLRLNNYLDDVLGKSIAYDQNHPPGGPSALLSIAKAQSTMKPLYMQQDIIQNADRDMAPAIFEEPSSRISISSKLPTASHQDPCFVSDLPSAITTPSRPGISQPSRSQTTCQAVSLPTSGVKRRLGMGRTTGGYSNKKFKPPT